MSTKSSNRQQSKKFIVIVRKQNALNYIVIVSDLTKLVMVVIVKVVITFKFTMTNEIMLFWHLWIGIQTLSARKYKKINTSKVVTAKNLTVLKNIVSAIKLVSNVVKTANVKNAKTCLHPIVKKSHLNKQWRWKGNHQQLKVQQKSKKECLRCDPDLINFIYCVFLSIYHLFQFKCIVAYN